MVMRLFALPFICSAAFGQSGCFIDANGDGVFDIDDVYEVTRSPVDVNGDGVADLVDVACVLRLFRQIDEFEGLLPEVFSRRYSVSVSTNANDPLAAEWILGDTRIQYITGRDAAGMLGSLDTMRVVAPEGAVVFRLDEIGRPIEVRFDDPSSFINISWFDPVDGDASALVSWSDGASVERNEFVTLPGVSFLDVEAAEKSMRRPDSVPCRRVRVVDPAGLPITGAEMRVAVFDPDTGMQLGPDVGEWTYWSEVDGFPGEYEVCLPSPCKSSATFDDAVDRVRVALGFVCPLGRQRTDAIAHALTVVSSSSTRGGQDREVARVPAALLAVPGLLKKAYAVTCALVAVDDRLADSGLDVPTALYEEFNAYNDWPKTVRVQASVLLRDASGSVVFFEPVTLGGTVDNIVDPCNQAAAPVDEVAVLDASFVSGGFVSNCSIRCDQRSIGQIVLDVVNVPTITSGPCRNDISVRLFDLSGNFIANKCDGFGGTGRRTITFSNFCGATLPAGTSVVRVEVAGALPFVQSLIMGVGVCGE